MTHATLGADLYGGTSGIAVFLAELAAATGGAGCRRTALGAIRHALAREPELPPTLNLGLCSGRIGIALAAERVGSLLADDDLLERGLAMVRHLEGTGTEFDLIGGRAGAIVGLLALQDLLGEPGLLERASRYGEELIGLAVKRARSWSWPSPGNPRARHLLGFSHGASGAGYALCELAHATKDEAFRDAAEKAFSYERRLFDAREAKWPDLRAAAPSATRAVLPAFMTAWCHGAPGIALPACWPTNSRPRLPIVTRQSWPSRRPAVMSKPSPTATQVTTPFATACAATPKSCCTPSRCWAPAGKTARSSLCG